MTDQPGPPPADGPEPNRPPGEPGSGPPDDAASRLPVPAERPAVPMPADRFTAPPQVRATEGLTPERSAGIVRQSSSARIVGFLTVIVVVIFVSLYWFYEIGGPLGITEPRLHAEATAQQVLTVERGYNVYQANCARCHGKNGEGGIGPVLNNQEKLFDHLNPNYLNNVLLVGGRYVCGNATSLMPVWSNQGNPPGPLNYRQIQEVIAFIRATSDQTYIIRDPELAEPELDPVTGKPLTFKGWVDPNYAPAPGATPFPACYLDALAGGGGSPTPAASVPPDAVKLTIIAENIAFTQTSLEAPAEKPWVIEFENRDQGTPHDVDIKDSTGAIVVTNDVFPGVATRDYNIPALKAGEYTFFCSVHTNMTGSLTVG
jgi:mono/diheme cytochrome c family protein/plastocyanin